MSREAPSGADSRISDVISDLDLKILMDDLDETLHENEKWQSVVEDQRNDSVSYSGKCRVTKDGGPLKYMSTIVFNNFCSPETLRDFYIDNSYRMEWDKTLMEHEKLQVDESGTEIVRRLKKSFLFPPREYVLAQRLWEGTDRTYYCYTKECDHPSAPRQKEYLRASVLRSGWRVREVPGRNSCEMKIVHQEDAGLNVDMTRMIFAKGIWAYVRKMDSALRHYPVIMHLQPTSAASEITLVQEAPLPLDYPEVSQERSEVSQEHSEVSHREVSQERSEKKPSGGSPKKVVATGLILGGVICLAHGHTNFIGQVVMSGVLSMLRKR